MPFKNGAAVEQSHWTEVEMSIALPECDPPAPSVFLKLKAGRLSHTLKHPNRSKLNLHSLAR